ncbi:putative DNA-binding transcriptional regulator AlpA [Crossiella equi]|uniref:DNA-binding transcriptional regulator AlpA n=1 Tax=Crossiella equi TaxID=130796 RepID=A0ABS5AEB2_9PSEU|nr:helix-turn-helix domain-containing protein [Crossiella equi]MBP2474040.1 putative DNA-binding transcriptional regulator AlpA [Crossiella equi]
MTTQMQPLWTAEDVAAFLGVPVTTLYAWRTKNYGPPARRIGRYLRYRPADVQGWVDQLEAEVA